MKTVVIRSAFALSVVASCVVLTLWIASSFVFRSWTIDTGDMVLGLALKKGYLDIEFTTIPGDAANRLGSFIWRPYGEETSPRISATFGAYPGQTIYPTSFNHQYAGRSDGYRWHSQFTEPKDFVADRWSQTLIGRWPAGSIVVLELPFYLLFLFSFYWLALRWFRATTRRVNAE